MKIFLSCEHGGNQVPDIYKHLFQNQEEILNTHRGYDKGALELYKTLLHIKDTYFSISNETTRLLVDCNRSLFRQNLFSPFTNSLDDVTKKQILDHYYYPYRNTFYENVKDVVLHGNTVFHISVHAFTPEIDGKIRNADIGILFNPIHGIEKTVAKYWRKILNEILPDLTVRLNYPFFGKPDGVVAPMRKEFKNKYLGFELELNSKHAGNIKINEGIKESIEKLIKQIVFYYGKKISD